MQKMVRPLFAMMVVTSVCLSSILAQTPAPTLTITTPTGPYPVAHTKNQPLTVVGTTSPDLVDGNYVYASVMVFSVEGPTVIQPPVKAKVKQKKQAENQPVEKEKANPNRQADKQPEDPDNKKNKFKFDTPDNNKEIKVYKHKSIKNRKGEKDVFDYEIEIPGDAFPLANTSYLIWIGRTDLPVNGQFTVQTGN